MTASVQSTTHDEQQLERLTFFSDAVFAIAMTLLVIEVKLPHIPAFTDAALGQALLRLIPNYIGFLVSFLVLGRFWVAHHNVMGLLRVSNGRLVAANLLFLLAVAFMPFPTAIISEYIQLRVGIGFYTGWLILLGLLNRQLVRIAVRHPELLEHGLTPEMLRPNLLRSWIPILIGVIAFAGGMISWIVALVVLMVGSPLIAHLVQRRAARMEIRTG